MTNIARHTAGLIVAVCGAGIGMGLAAREPAPPSKQPPAAAAPAADVAQGGLFDADAKHLWNRVHGALAARRFPESGDEYAETAFEPFPVDDAAHLLTEARHREMVRLLDEFLSPANERLVKDPLKRAWMQRNLWTMFDWTADRAWEIAPRQEDAAYDAERRALRRRLASAIRRLALSPREIEQLADNYAVAVAQREFPAEFDPRHPDRPYLPADLWQPDGPWVLLGNRVGGALAREHHQFFGGRAAFFVFLRLPAGREATREYLESLHEHQRKRLPPPANFADAARAPPQFPADTQVALVRRTMLIDERGRPAVSPLTETVQLRVYRDFEVTAASQAQFELRARPAELLAGHGRLHFVGAEGDRSYVLYLGQAKDPEGAETIQGSCRHCHSSPGVASLNSFAGATVHRGEPSILTATTFEEEAHRARQSSRGYAWGLLRGYWEADQPEASGQKE
jgi:hypothetical protein